MPQTKLDPAHATLEEQIAWLRELRVMGTDPWLLADGLAAENFNLRSAVDQVKEMQKKVRDELNIMCAPEQYPAVVTGVHVNGSLTAEVFGAGMNIEVGVHPSIPKEKLRVGARVLLTKGRNCLLKLLDDPSTNWRDIGKFEGYTAKGKLLLRFQEQLISVTPTEELAEEKLRKGDLIGFDFDWPRLAYVRIDPPDKDDLFFEGTPNDSFEELGGLEREIAVLKRYVTFRLKHPEVANRYLLPDKYGILLEGPPGNGKTKMARCLARFVSELTGVGDCRFMLIAGSGDYSMWLGQTEQKIRARFEAVRELATKGGVPVLMCFEELDALGLRRGSDYGSGAPDRILSTFLSELDGIQKVPNVILLGTTNRADRLDNGLIREGRFGDCLVHIGAPNRSGSRAILTRYLQGLPVIGELASMVEVMLSRIFSPRSDYAELAKVKLRDGRVVPVGAKDFISGARLESLVKRSAMEAADREVQTGIQGGITADDLSASLAHALKSAAAVLTPYNARGYIPRLPQDVDPVAIEFLQK